MNIVKAFVCRNSLGGDGHSFRENAFQLAEAYRKLSTKRGEFSRSDVAENCASFSFVFKRVKTVLQRLFADPELYSGYACLEAVSSNLFLLSDFCAYLFHGEALLFPLPTDLVSETLLVLLNFVQTEGRRLLEYTTKGQREKTPLLRHMLRIVRELLLYKKNNAENMRRSFEAFCSANSLEVSSLVAQLGGIVEYLLRQTDWAELAVVFQLLGELMALFQPPGRELVWLLYKKTVRENVMPNLAVVKLILRTFVRNIYYSEVGASGQCEREWAEEELGHILRNACRIVSVGKDGNDRNKNGSTTPDQGFERIISLTPETYPVFLNVVLECHHHRLLQLIAAVKRGTGTRQLYKEINSGMKRTLRPILQREAAPRQSKSILGLTIKYLKLAVLLLRKDSVLVREPGCHNYEGDPALKKFFKAFYNRTIEDVFAFIKNIQNRSNRQTALDADVKANEELRQYPNLIYLVEDFNKLYIKYSREVGADIEPKDIKSISRDFRVDNELLYSQIAENKDEKKKKPRCLDNSSYCSSSTQVDKVYDSSLPSSDMYDESLK